jgi:ABC-type Fe3+-hydroxamate transport system substrate-binding protein
MKLIPNLLGLATLGLTLAQPVWADVTVTDLKGRSVTLPDTAKRVLLGF